jgi:hypothetical protein
MLSRLREAWSGPVDDSRAWTCLTVNLLGLPGLGSLLGRRLVAAAGQLVLSLAGAGISLWWIVSVVGYWLQNRELPPPGPDLLLALGGLALFGLGWLWSLATSLMLLREAHRRGAAGRGVESDLDRGRRGSTPISAPLRKENR